MGGRRGRGPASREERITRVQAVLTVVQALVAQERASGSIHVFKLRAVEVFLYDYLTDLRAEQAAEDA